MHLVGLFFYLPTHCSSLPDQVPLDVASHPGPCPMGLSRQDVSTDVEKSDPAEHASLLSPGREQILSWLRVDDSPTDLSQMEGDLVGRTK